MQEIERFFSNLFSSIFNRFKYSAMDATERKVKDTINQQVEQYQQRSKPKDREDRQ
ncbi:MULTISPECIES: hypothetical protein [Nostoc]|jgi:hypothetical protein|uniref:Uncharacterized protein n=1 Tax=Nostoc punctiforme FACHB-252 TaxID=1357509 RepID=A0ABR8HGT5_NOSPU|nr:MULTISPECIES: hypothetical protein [Nostoc]MBC1238155.1 hypothetical protein [Nostoc sp. 2RC]MBD2615030.1 hypothetical protein [Nostoc punctiforme FACHB-252]MDZ8012284.1 hypothetical protein [Nostoc sp. ZfuVER08]